MPRLPFVRHPTERPILRAYRACRHPVETTRWHAVRPLARADQDRTPAAVADPAGLSAVAARAVLPRWNDRGPDGPADRRRGNGAGPELAARQRGALFAALPGRPPDGGRWSGPKVARGAADRWAVTVRPGTGWRWLRDLGFTSRVPRPGHPRSASPPARGGWEKTSAAG